MNPLTNAVDELFSLGAERGFLHCNAEDFHLDGRSVRIRGQRLTNFSLCSYLGLELDERVKAGAIDAIERYGASFIMSRTFASSPGFPEFEHLLEQILDAPVVVTPSTTLGHLSFFDVFINQGDLVLLDIQVHNSVQMAAKTISERARVQHVLHNDIPFLERFLKLSRKDPTIRNVWYFGDGIYSMLGDTCPLPDLVRLLDTYDNFYCYLDDAHGMSAFGDKGCGWVLGQKSLRHSKMVVAVSLSKSFGMGCGGAIALPNEEWRRKLRTCGPTMIFSTPIPPPMIGAGIACAKIHLSEEFPELQNQLLRRVRLFRQSCLDNGVALVTPTETPIQFIQAGTLEQTIHAVQKVFDSGFFVNICGYPAVPKDNCGVRVTLTNHHLDEDLRALAAVLPTLKRPG